jgi:predicted anti-sigma-YlaC factor YlaD
MLEIRLSVIALSNPSWARPRVCTGMTKIIGLFVSFLAIVRFLSSSSLGFRKKEKVTVDKRITKTAAKIPIYIFAIAFKFSFFIAVY